MNNLNQNKYLINCHSCGKEIHKSSKICPYCGAKKPWYKKPGNCVAIGILIFFIIGVIGSIGDTESNTVSNTTVKNNTNISNEEKNNIDTSNEQLEKNSIQQDTEKQNDIIENEEISTTEIEVINTQDKEIIRLKYGELGVYGKKDTYNNRYYIPNGNYEVKDNTGTSLGFFIIKNEKIKNSEGKLEDVIIDNIRFENNDIAKNITVPKDAHIVLFANSDFNFVKIN